MNYPDYGGHHTPQAHSGAPQPIDWNLVAEIFPALFSALCWIVWGLSLLIPSIFGLHYTTLFSTANNVIFVLMGFVLCMAMSTAIRAGHGARAIFFALSISLLSFWF